MRMMDAAYIRDRANIEHGGESLLLACLVHCKKDHKRSAQRDVEIIMRDQNIIGDRKASK